LRETIRSQIISAFQHPVAIKLVLLGTGGYFPTSQRHTACLMLPEVGVVLDAGSGMCRLGQVLATDRLDVFLTHAHLDHVAGLTYLVNVVPPEVLKKTTIHGAGDKLEAVREHLFADLIFPVPPPFRFEPLDGTCALPDGGRLSHYPLKHPGGSLGFRLDWPAQSLAYVTDTTAQAAAVYVEKIRGVDLLVHEAYFADDSNDLPAITGHSSLIHVAEVAKSANVGRLVLVHIAPTRDDGGFDLSEARTIFGSIEIGRDQMTIDF
jgi:ribonuclease BN (tRNA processing enzyme)